MIVMLFFGFLWSLFNVISFCWLSFGVDWNDYLELFEGVIWVMLLIISLVRFDVLVLWVIFIGILDVFFLVLMVYVDVGISFFVSCNLNVE